MGKAQIKPHFVAWSLLEPISIPVALGPLGSLPRILKNEINGLAHGEGWISDPFPPPLALEKPFSPSGCGRIFLLFSRVMLGGLFTNLGGRKLKSALSLPIFSEPVDWADLVNFLQGTENAEPIGRGS